MTTTYSAPGSVPAPLVRDQTLPQDLNLLPFGNASTVRHFRYGVENMIYNNVLYHIVGVGDSILFGSLASTRPRSYWEVFRTELHRLLGISPIGDGNIHLASTAFGNPKWAISVGAPADTTVGFGQKAKTFAVADAMTFTGTFRRMLLLYQQVSGSTATLKIQDSINGILQAGLAMSGTATGNWGIYDTGDLGANAARTMTLTGQVAPLTVVSSYFMSSVNEVVCWNGGVSGITMINWNASGANDIFGQAFNSNGLSQLSPVGTMLMIEMGTNDGIQGTDIKTSFTSMINTARAVLWENSFNYSDGTPTPVILTPPARPNNRSQTTWINNCLRAIYALAPSLNCSIIDLGKNIGTSQGDITFGLHPNDVQHAFMGKDLARILFTTAF